MKALIDADILRYQIGAIQLEHPFVPKARIPAPVSDIEYHLEELITHVRAATGCTEYVCALSGKGNFRLDIAKQEPYKGKRDPSKTRPYHYDTVGDYIIRNHPHVIVDGREADDWLAEEQRKDPENTIICSRDKDLWTVLGWHFRWACGDKQPEVPNHFIDEFESRRFFFQQMLTGDSTDNIIGCGKKVEMMWGGKLMLRRKGVGETAAKSLLAACSTVKEMFDIVELYYQNEFGDEYKEVMLENARLLYVGQTPDNLFEWDWINYDTEINSNETDSSDSSGQDQSNSSDQPGGNLQSGVCSSGEQCDQDSPF